MTYYSGVCQACGRPAGFCGCWLPRPGLTPPSIPDPAPLLPPRVPQLPPIEWEKRIEKLEREVKRLKSAYRKGATDV